MVNVYVDAETPRLRWTMKLLFGSILGMEYRLVVAGHKPERVSGPALNYAAIPMPGIPAIHPYGLLSEQGIRTQKIIVTEHEGLPVFFQSDGGDLPFDPFAMAFYLVSRYEEYLPFNADRHGRFPAAESLAYREGFLVTALVDRLSGMIRTMLKAHFPGLEFPARHYCFIPTVDVDIAFAHLGKGFIRTWGAMAKQLLKGNLAEAGRRMATMTGLRKDPYDNFDFMLEAFGNYGLDPVFFILAGERGPYDRNLSTANRRFAGLIRYLNEKASIGIHPSYKSFDEPYRLEKEIEGLGAVAGSIISRSRQHFVRIKFPGTCRNLIANGIATDYSMGYPDATGFRASVATPFNFYDLTEERETGLKVFPFAFMDTTFSDYMGLEPAEYAAAVKPIIEETKQCGGTLCGIWHNYALADDPARHAAFTEIIKLAGKG